MKVYFSRGSGISAETLHENMTVSSVVVSQTPALARSLAAEPGGAISNRRRQWRSRTRVAYVAPTKSIVAACPPDLWIAMAELHVRRRKPRNVGHHDAMI
jgi:hypothetical protein